MPLAEFLETYRPAYGDTWLDAVAALTEDPDEAETLTALRAVLACGDDFNEPVKVDDEDGYVSNGMHRIAASILEGRPTIWFTDRWPDPGPMVEVKFRCPLPDGDTGDDLICRVFSRLRSFPHPAGWVEAVNVSLSNGRFEGVWYCPPALTGPELAAVLVARVADLGLQAGDMFCGPWADSD